MPYKDNPKLPYYAVIFTSKQSTDLDGYSDMAMQMELLAQQQPGYLGMDHARSNVGITISYWKDQESIFGWKNVTEHLHAQERGRNQWYSQYTVRVCRVEREYSWESTDNSS